MMKFIVLLFVVGCASASFYDALNRASDEVVLDFLIGMDKTPSLRSYIGAGAYSEEVDQIDDDIKTNLGKTLKESLDRVLEKIRDSVDHGKEVSKELVNKAKDIADKLKELGQDAGVKAKELLQKLKEKARGWLQELLAKVGLNKRGLSDFIGNLIGEIDVEAMLQKLKDRITAKVDVEGIKDYIRKIFGDSALGKALLDTLKTKGLAAIKNLISKILPNSVSGAEYTLAETWENIKAFFKNAKGELSAHFVKFSEWVRDVVKTGLDNTKTKAANLKELAKQTVAHGKELSKEAAREALEFFQPYKEDLGSLWAELKETIANAIGRPGY